jgi:acyl carrier protein
VGEVADNVRRFLITELRIPDGNLLAADYPLIKRGVLDSIELMQVVSFLESEYKIGILDTEIVPENLGSLDRMEALVRRKLPPP